MQVGDRYNIKTHACAPIRSVQIVKIYPFHNGVLRVFFNFMDNPVYLCGCLECRLDSLTQNMDFSQKEFYSIALGASNDIIKETDHIQQTGPPYIIKEEGFCF